ncbi:hypothetical protein LTSEINV_2825 [Salmonella enterica subsp. enterica serovar Inverness str. R8-3668]|uniref:Uncharacterized protein n=1 Tax=Salmonella enterica subsp. enterica serovar Inverness str. R8-3668 TaxID=913075 RepID=G5NDT7_SALET|nr:hypothetical protein LTSEINV_2825 [Salmonella enterica subsp. enterica serovar Inverness str. R8-3668]
MMTISICTIFSINGYMVSAFILMNIFLNLCRKGSPDKK